MAGKDDFQAEQPGKRDQQAWSDGMDMDNVGMQSPGLQDSQKGMNYCFKAFFAGGMDVRQGNTAPFRTLLGDIRGAGREDNLMTGGGNQGV